MGGFMELEDLKNKKHIEKINSEKAVNILKICVVIFIISFITYAIALFFGNFDFVGLNSFDRCRFDTEIKRRWFGLKFFKF